MGGCGAARGAEGYDQSGEPSENGDRSPPLMPNTSGTPEFRRSLAVDFRPFVPGGDLEQAETAEPGLDVAEHGREIDAEHGRNPPQRHRPPRSSQQAEVALLQRGQPPSGAWRSRPRRTRSRGARRWRWTVWSSCTRSASRSPTRGCTWCACTVPTRIAGATHCAVCGETCPARRRRRNARPPPHDGAARRAPRGLCWRDDVRRAGPARPAADRGGGGARGELGEAAAEGLRGGSATLSPLWGQHVRGRVDTQSGHHRP